MWDSGLDYLHGTGHGVGSFLNVHEGPCGISYKTFSDEPLEAGMIVTDGRSLSPRGCAWILWLFESSLLYGLRVAIIPNFGGNASKALIFTVKVLVQVDILLVSNQL